MLEKGKSLIHPWLVYTGEEFLLGGLRWGVQSHNHIKPNCS